MSIESLYQEIKAVRDVQTELAPIQTAISRAKAEHDKLAVEVATLAEEAESLKDANAKAQEIIAQAEAQKQAADIYMQQVRRDAADLESRASSKAAKIIRDEYANKAEVEREIESLQAQRREMIAEIDSLRSEKRQAEAELAPLKAEVETLRHQRAAYLRQEMGV